MTSPEHAVDNAASPRGKVATWARMGFGGLATASIAALVVLNFGGAASSAVNASSSVTVKWLGDAGPASSVQPTRDPNGFEYNEFKNITVTVEQTKDLLDQAVKVDVTGFAGGTTTQTDFSGQSWSSAQNFMQAMECRGDPSSADFRNTCEWGGRFASNNGLGNSIYPDNDTRVGPNSLSASAVNPVDVPFVGADGITLSGRQQADTKGNVFYPIFDDFSPQTSSELQSAAIKSDGTGEFDFEAKSNIRAPHLGCGQASQLTCYLVLVPRGTIYGGHGVACSNIVDGNFDPYSYGRPNSIQAGSPLNPGCDYWNNRIVVPLTFAPVALACPSSHEVRLDGSQLLISAMASWQPTLCTSAKATFSFTTNPDSVARAQLLEKTIGLALTSYPIERAKLDSTDDQSAFDTTTLSYAPVAIGAVTVAFVADGIDGQITSLNLSPRLMAKLLTQSYMFELPTNSSDAGNDALQLGKQNQKYAYLNEDPDFRALNPNADDFITNPSIIEPGPSGADAVAQLWKWVQSDKDARDFLDGKADPWGMTVNPYYLPAGNAAALAPSFRTDVDQQVVDANGKPVLTPVGLTNIDSTPLSLSNATIDYFLRADQSQVPHVLSIQRTRYDSIQAMPYVNDFITAARSAFRADPEPRTNWDPTKLDAAGDQGDWVSTGPQVRGTRFVIAVTDSASADRYDLTAASLQSANSTTLTQPDVQHMQKAIDSGLVATSVAAVKQVDPAQVSTDSYPLTTVVYAAVNLSASSSDDRAAYSKMIQYVTGDGQTSGTGVGQLPLGYLPLTSAMATQANAAAVAISAYIPPVTSSSSDPDNSLPLYSSTGSGGSIPVSADGTPSIAPTSSPAATGKTPAVPSAPVANAALGISLGIGAAGSIASPMLLRRRRP